MPGAMTEGSSLNEQGPVVAEAGGNGGLDRAQRHPGVLEESGDGLREGPKDARHDELLFGPEKATVGVGDREQQGVKGAEHAIARGPSADGTQVIGDRRRTL